MRRIPVACTLAEDDAHTRVTEWQRFLGAEVTEVERTGGVVRLQLRDDDAALLAAVDLARRETVCCAFLEFRLTVLADAVRLEIEAPEEAAPILDGLIGCLQAD